MIYCAITGVAGSGKSELAKAYVTQCRTSTNFIWRLDPDPDTSYNDAKQILYTSAFKELLYNFDLENKVAFRGETLGQMHRRLVRSLWGKISQYSESMLIFDNAATCADIEKYLPTDPDIKDSVKGLILVTTQNLYFFDQTEQNLSLNQGLKEGGAELLAEISQYPLSEGAETLAERLDYLPLGLRIAGKFIRIQRRTDSEFSFEKYMTLMDHNVSPHLGTEAAIYLSINKIKIMNSKLYKLLEWCVFLDAQKLSSMLLLDLYRELDFGSKDQEAIDLVIQMKFGEIMGEETYSLIVYDQVTKNYYIHRTTQAAIQKSIKDPMQIVQEVMTAMIQVYEIKEYSEEVINRCENVKPHLDALCQRIDSDWVYRKKLFTDASRLKRILVMLFLKESFRPELELTENKRYMLRHVKEDGMRLGCASPELQKDGEIVLAAVKQNGRALEYASPELQKDREIVLAAVEDHGDALRYASPELQNDKRIVYAAVKDSSYALKHASSKMKNDRRIVLSAVEHYGQMLKYASPELRRDPEIVYLAVVHYGGALEYTSEELKKDKKFILGVVGRSPWALQFASEELKKDKEFILGVVGRSPRALEFASEELKKDKEFILAAVAQDGQALKYASEELRNDKDIVYAAVKHHNGLMRKEIVYAAIGEHGAGLKYASQELKRDRHFVLIAVKRYGCVLSYVCEDMKKDKEIVLVAVQQDGMALQYANEELRGDKELVCAAVTQNGQALQFASKELRNHRDIVLEAVQHPNDLIDSNPLEYASQELKHDQKIISAAVRNSRRALDCAILTYLDEKERALVAFSMEAEMLEHMTLEFRNDPEIVLAAIQKKGWVLRFASPDLRNNKQFMLTVIQHHAWAIRCVGPELRGNREFVLAAVKYNDRVLEYASKEMKSSSLP